MEQSGELILRHSPAGLDVEETDAREPNAGFTVRAEPFEVWDRVGVFSPQGEQALAFRAELSGWDVGVPAEIEVAVTIAPRRPLKIHDLVVVVGRGPVPVEPSFAEAERLEYVGERAPGNTGYIHGGSLSRWTAPREGTAPKSPPSKAIAGTAPLRTATRPLLPRLARNGPDNDSMCESDLRVHVLLSMQRAMWEAVTPDLRGVALALPDPAAGHGSLSARFLYEGEVGEFQRELTSLVETYVMADFPQIPSSFFTDFQAVARAERQLLNGEEWVYLRWESDAPKTIGERRGAS